MHYVRLASRDLTSLEEVAVDYSIEESFDLEEDTYRDMSCQLMDLINLADEYCFR